MWLGKQLFFFIQSTFSNQLLADMFIFKQAVNVILAHRAAGCVIPWALSLCWSRCVSWLSKGGAPKRSN